MTLQVDRSAMEAIRGHGRRQYPHECCGFLVGRLEPRQASQAIPARNVHPDADRLKDRFTIDPRDFLIADREARRRGLEIVGFYHSHPDHPARPSATDAEWAHPVYSYVILSVRQGEPAEATSWRFDEGEFQPETVEEVVVPLG